MVLLIFILSFSLALAKRVHWSTSIEGQLRELVVARDFDTGKRDIFGISSNQQIWTCRLPCDGKKNKWSRLPGTAAHIAVNQQEIWVTRSDYTIWRCSRPCTSNNEWKQVGGLLRTLSLGSEVVWGINHYDDVFRATARPKQAIQWEYIPGGKFKWISVASDNDVWGVMKSGDIVRFVPKDKTWKRISGKAKRISVGVKNVFIVNDGDQLFKCKRPCSSGHWKRLNGKLRVVSVESTDSRSIYGLRPDNSIAKGKFKRQKCPKPIKRQPSYNPWLWWWIWKRQQQQQQHPQYPHILPQQPVNLWSNANQQTSGVPSWTQYMQYLQQLQSLNTAPQSPNTEPSSQSQQQPQVMPWWAQLPPWNWNQH